MTQHDLLLKAAHEAAASALLVGAYSLHPTTNGKILLVLGTSYATIDQAELEAAENTPWPGGFILNQR